VGKKEASYKGRKGTIKRKGELRGKKKISSSMWSSKQTQRTANHRDRQRRWTICASERELGGGVMGVSPSRLSGGAGHSC